MHWHNQNVVLLSTVRKARCCNFLANGHRLWCSACFHSSSGVNDMRCVRHTASGFSSTGRLSIFPIDCHRHDPRTTQRQDGGHGGIVLMCWVKVRAVRDSSQGFPFTTSPVKPGKLIHDLLVRIKTTII